MAMLDQDRARPVLRRSLPRSVPRCDGPDRSMPDRPDGRICHIECRPAELRRGLRMADGRARLRLRHAGRRRAAGVARSPTSSTKMPNRRGFTSSCTGDADSPVVPSISGLVHGPSVDWHEREVEDLFGLMLRGASAARRLRPARGLAGGRQPDAPRFRRRGSRSRFGHPSRDGSRRPSSTAPGAFAMPIGPVFSDFAEVGAFPAGDRRRGRNPHHPAVFLQVPRRREDRRGPAGRPRAAARRALFGHRRIRPWAWPSARPSRRSAGSMVPQRARALRTVLAELERLRHHAAVITGICNSTALAVATSQAALIEEELLRLSARWRATATCSGSSSRGPRAAICPPSNAGDLAAAIAGSGRSGCDDLHRMLRYSSSFLDRLEEVGIVSPTMRIAYGLVGPIARASGMTARHSRKLFPYAAYDSVDFRGSGRAAGRRLCPPARALSRSGAIGRDHRSGAARRCPTARSARSTSEWRAGVALWPPSKRRTARRSTGCGSAPDGTVARYRVTPPSFPNWHGFHLAAENFAFQDFPIILASFGLSNAECDR